MSSSRKIARSIAKNGPAAIRGVLTPAPLDGQVAHFVIWASDGAAVDAEIVPNRAELPSYGRGVPHVVFSQTAPTFEQARDNIRRLIARALKDAPGVNGSSLVTL